MTDNSIQLDSGGSYLFVGNSYTFGRVDPVMSYNSDNVRDLTAPVPGTTFANTTGSNPYEPHPWGGVPGLFQAFASEAGLELDVAISARNAATLQGQYLNSNPAGWDLRGNVASQPWDVVVLQDNSTQALPSGAGAVTFAAGSSTATLTIHPTADTTVETDETVGLQITPGSTYRTSAGVVTGTILNDDPTGPTVNPALPTVTLVANPGAVLEDGPQNLVYTFTRTGPTTSALTVNFAAARDGSTAPSVASGGDFENNANQFTTSFQANGVQTTGNVSFTSNTGSVVIPAGASSVTFTLDPRPDATVENDESIRLTLSTNANYNVGTKGAVSVTILNDDFAAGTDTSLPNISLSLAASAVYEDGSGDLVYVFTRTGSNTAPLTVNFGVSGTATLPGNDFTVTGANSFSTPGAADPDLASFNTYAVKLAQYATTGAADGAVPANPHANAATDVYLYETWARPNMVTGAVVANTDDTTGAVTNTAVTAPEYYVSLEAMTADLRAAYEGLAAANPIFAGVAPVGAAFLAAVQDGTALRDPYAPDAGADGKIDLWWDDNLHASKYGSYLSGLTLFGTLTGLDPRSLGAAEHVAADLGITPAVAAALQAVAAATLGFSLDAHWTAPGQVAELQGGVTGLLATAGSFGFSDSDVADTHTITFAPLTQDSIGTFTAALHTDTTGDGTGGAVNWLFTVDNADVAFLAPGATRVEHFLVTIADANGGVAQRDIAVTITGSYNNAPAAVVDSNPANDAGGVNGAIAEGAAANALVGITASSTDPEDGSNVTYSLTNSASGLFQIDATTGVVTVSAAGATGIDYETAAGHAYTITVQAADTQGGTSTQDFVIGVTDAAPTVPVDGDGVSGGSVSEGASNGDAVGITASSTDVNGGVITYSLTDAAGGRFAIDAAGVVHVANAALLNYESATGHSITVQAADASGAATTQTFTIAVTNVAPVATGDSYNVAEDNTLTVAAAAGVLINDSEINGGTITAALDAGPTHASSFHLNADGSFDYTPSADFNGADSFTYHAFDGTTAGNIVTVTLGVSAVNDAPVNTVPGSLTALTNSDHAVSGLSVSDVDATSLTTTLHVDHGTLAVAAVGGGATVGGSGTDTVTLTGSVAQIDATLAAFNNVLYHSAFNFNGTDHLTMTSNDGGGTGAGGALSDTDMVAISVLAEKAGFDADANGHSDILWHNDNGADSIWDNGDISAAHIVANPGAVASSWHIAGTADFDGNGHSDILWRNDNGALSIWDDSQIGQAHIIVNPGVVPGGWHIAGTGDFDGNGHGDILWQNDNGAVSIWDNGSIASAHVIANAGGVPSGWHIAGTGDFDGNGHGDILWQNDNGAVSIWDNGNIASAHIIANAGGVPSGWHIAGSGDFDGNGHGDILWQNDNGAVSIWDNGNIASAHIIANAGGVPSGWHIAGSGDFDGNGKSDILWRNDNGAVSIWDNAQINNAHIIANAGVVPDGWHIV